MKHLPSLLDELTYEEIIWLIEQDTNDKQEYFETMRVAFQVAYINVNTKGKDKTLFVSNTSSKSSSNITKEERDRELANLKQIFEIDN